MANAPDSNGQPRPSTTLPLLALLASMISLCVGSAFAKSLFPALGAEGAAFCRIASGALILVAWQRPWRWAIDRQAIRLIGPYAAALGFMNVSFYLALKTLPLGLAIAIELTGPLALAVALSRRPTDFLWVGLAVAGLLILLPFDRSERALDALGVAYAFASGGFWVLYILWGKRASCLPAGQVTSLGLVGALVITAPFGATSAAAVVFSPELLVATLAVGVLSSALPYSLEMVALKGLPPRVFGVFLSMEPVIGSLAAAAVLKEHLSLPQWVAVLAIMAASAGCAATASAQTAPVQPSPQPQNQTQPNQEPSKMNPEIVKAFAPTGVLRASLNVGNPVLANRDASGKPFGISIDLARKLAERLGVELEMIVNETAGKSVATMESGKADIGFFAIDPERGKDVSFTAPYVLIEGFYLVRNTSPIAGNAQVDVPGVKIVVGKGSAYDLFLTRTIKQAEIVRAESSQAVVRTFLDQGIDVAAGVRQQLEADTRGMDNVRLLGERFMVIRQAMGVPKSRGPQAAAFLRTFVEEMKADGVVQDSMVRHGIKGAGVAPAADPAQDPLAAP